MQPVYLLITPAMRSYRISFLLVTLTLLFSCETEFDVTADWEEVTVVYGLLDQHEPFQYIKINKGFLGEGNALSMASEQDSSNYPYKLKVKIEEYDGDQINLIRTIDFDTIHVMKEGGIFPEEQVIYKSQPVQPLDTNYLGDITWLEQDHYYKLVIDNPVTGKQITSGTELVEDFEITKPGFQTEINFKFDQNTQDIKQSFEWDKSANGARYEFRLDFIFDEVDAATLDTITRTINISSVTLFPSASQSSVLFKVAHKDFYENCLNKIPYEDPAKEENVESRLHGFVDVVVAVATEDYNNYISVYEPSQTIVQEKPLYTNIENGIGIFSSRFVNVKTKKVNNENLCYLNDYSLEIHGVDKDLKFFCDN